MILFSEEEETTENRAATQVHKPNTIEDQQNLNSNSSDSPNTEQLYKIIEAQQKQIDSLTSMIRDREAGQQTKESRNYSRPPPVCFECGKVGHIKRNCRSKLRETATKTSENM